MGYIKSGQVINTHTGNVFADIHSDRIEIHPLFFRENLKLCGIVIPEGLKENFGQRRVVHYKDSDFSKAFLEIYFPRVLSKQGYELRYLG